MGHGSQNGSTVSGNIDVARLLMSCREQLEFSISPDVDSHGRRTQHVVHVRSAEHPRSAHNDQDAGPFAVPHIFTRLPSADHGTGLPRRSFGVYRQ